MSKKISRRDFLKISGVSATALAVLTGCGPASRYVVRKPYTDMPEYNQTGLSTYYATGCRECPAGCGLVVRTKEGRAIKVEGNLDHPVNRGKVCSRGLTSIQGLYNPDRIQGPRKQAKRGSDAFNKLGWDTAIQQVSDALLNTSPEQIAFFMGLAPDHLYDLAQEITQTLGSPSPIRYSTLGMFEGRGTLVEATKKVFGKATLPFFDLANASYTISFGANFLETWLSPVQYSRAYGQMRQGIPGKRGYLVVIEPRMSLTGANADVWLPAKPGTEGKIAAALLKLVADIRGENLPPSYGNLDWMAIAEEAGIPVGKLSEIAHQFVAAEHPLAIPGGQSISHGNGLATAETVLAINSMVKNLGQAGGVFLAPADPQVSSISDIQNLIQLMKGSKIKVLFIHAANPVFELPPSLGFTEALAQVPLVISFASFPDETALQSDFIFPDHTPLKSWGYQRVLAGSDRPAMTAYQPVVVPLYDTHATADVLLAAMKKSGKLAYGDEVDFLQKKLVPFLQQGKGFYTAPEILTFWSQWLQFGGWWTASMSLESPAETSLPDAPGVSKPVINNGQYFLVSYPTQLGDGSGANRPWLQETPDPMTTAMWNSWIEIHPDTARSLGIQDDDVVKIKSSTGEVEAIAYLYPAIRPDTVAIPFGQGHTALGRWAKDRGCNPATLLSATLNESGDLAFGDTAVSISQAGRRQQLSRAESREGIYGKLK